MKTILITFSFLLIFSQSAFSLLMMDTNLIQEVKKSSIQVELEIVPENILPNSYLSSGKVEEPPVETIGRRFDLLFFIALPVTFYLTLNIMQIRNNSFGLSTDLSQVDWTYIYWNTLFIPMAVAYYDQQYIQEQKAIKLKNSSLSDSAPQFEFNMNLLSYRF